MYILYGDVLKNIYVDRCGVICYYVDSDNEIHFLLGKDRETKQLTDFGGRAYKNENALQTTIREFYEESRGIFKPYYHHENYDNAIVLTDKKTISITFIEVDEHHFTNSRSEFFLSYKEVKSAELKRKEYNEVEEIDWIKEKLLVGMLKKRSDIWIYISSFLKKSLFNENFNFIERIKNKKQANCYFLLFN